MKLNGKNFNFAQALREYLERKHITSIDFANKIGKDKSHISRWLNEGHEPYVNTILKIDEQHPGFIDDLIPDWAESLQQTTTTIKNIQNTPPDKTKSQNKPHWTPVYDLWGHAGISSLVNVMENTRILYHVSVPGYEDCVAWVKVKGDCMNPILKNGDHVALKKTDNKNIFWGRIYFIEFKGDFPAEPEIKYIYQGKDKNHWILRSENKEKYHDVEINHNEMVREVYRVKGGVVEF